jgi:rRNA maturation endonuclease Nob1
MAKKSFHTNKTIPLTWQMICNQCKYSFEIEIPKGPREEKQLRCPRCGSIYIQRAEASSTIPSQCGG